MDKVKRMLMTILTSGIATILSFLISFSLTPYITNKLGVEAYGFVTLAKNFTQYATIITIALNSYAARYITVSYHKNDMKKSQEYISSVFYGDVTISAVIMIIAVGFKVNSERAVQFRKWVNQIAKDYTIKGWVMDDERLKRGTYLTDKYFDEQLERIREIRASERKFYQKITDIYATAIDYDKTSATTKRFYATVQNKMHFAVHGHTAAELIVERADHQKEHMGLTTWADAPDGKIKKSDVTIAKNYLSENELHQMNRMVTAYLDFAENMTLRRIPLTMEDWEKRLNSFIEMFDYGILQDAGKVSAEIAKLHAETEFEKYRIVQDRLFMSDYDKYLLELEEKAKK